ncbi:hypothetical protein IWX85_002052 [Polaromonas sp. CG_9.11]|nr:hypothetical protein [Polaromonas sp. CG_9.11]
MTYWVCPELPAAAVRSSQETYAAVYNSAPLATYPEATYKSGKVVLTSGISSVHPNARNSNAQFGKQFCNPR